MLVDSKKAQQVCRCCQEQSASLAFPKCGTKIISLGEDCSLSYVEAPVGKGVEVDEATREFKVQVFDTASGVGVGDQTRCDGRGPLVSPDDQP
jgi:hypothetical protein